MSFDYLTTTKVLDSVRPQEPQLAPFKSGPEMVAGGIERKESAASGQLLPPGRIEEEVDTEQVASAVSKISDFVQNFQRDLQFSIDQTSGRTIIEVVDSETKQVIRQIPSEETLRMAEQLDSPESLIFSERA